jgi:hypothetical protein
MISMGTIEQRKPKMPKNAEMKPLKKKVTFRFLQGPT